MSTADKAASRPKRRHSGTASWHMSRQAVSLSVPEIAQWTDRQCLEFLVEVRFGSWKTVSCHHCGTVGEHYWRPLEKRWKCKACGSPFSITSGTVFARRKKPLQYVLTSVLMWLNSAAGQPALELKRHMNTTYNTAFTLQHKMREALVRGYNVGLISGDVEMDGAHQSGRRAAEKRGRPQGSRPVDQTDKEALTAIMLTQSSRDAARKKNKKGGVVDPEFGNALPESRRILFAVRKRSGVRGQGASATRVAIGLVEDAAVAGAVMKDYVAVSESCLNTDASPAYTELGKRFRVHRTVEHSKELSGPNGENNNQAEELNARFDRAEKGIYLNIEPKYMLDYAVETAFRSDTRRLPNGQQLKLAMHVALGVGESLYWKGFTRGRHRPVELTHPQPRPALASGPRKGRHPISSANGRPPR
jgi:transposase-like protein